MVKALVVDDSSLMRSVVKNFIKKAGHDVVGEAADGEEAVKKYEELRPDVVFLDILMPKMDGIETLKAIMGKNRLAKVVMCSSVLDNKTKENAMGIGAIEYIMKPFHQKDIDNALKKVTG